MNLKLSGEVKSVTFRGGNYQVEVELRQDYAGVFTVTHDSGEKSSVARESFRLLGTFVLHVDRETALELTKDREVRFLHIEVDSAKSE